MKLILKLLVTIICLSPTFASAQKVFADYDKSVDFSHYKTYAWSQGRGARNEFVNQMILKAVDEQLAAKGLTKVTDNPDLQLAYMAAVGYGLEVAKPSWGNAALPVFMGTTTIGQSWSVTTGTLVVDLFDKKSDRMIWRGAAKDTLDPPTGNDAKDAQRAEKTVKKAVEKMFKKFPIQR